MQTSMLVKNLGYMEWAMGNKIPDMDQNQWDGTENLKQQTKCKKINQGYPVVGYL